MTTPPDAHHAPARAREEVGDRERTILIPTSCWRPDLNSKVPARRERRPAGCPDADYCWGNNLCFWHCVDDGRDWDV